jgi:predicted enzyme related to lactoylglutathione lyase
MTTHTAQDIKETQLTTRRRARGPGPGARVLRSLLAGVIIVPAVIFAARAGADVPTTEDRMKISAKPTARATKNSDAAPRPVAWFEVTGKDGARLRSFYSDLFGWKTHDVAPGADFGVTDRPDDGIGGGMGAIPNSGPGHVTFFVEVTDLEATLREVERLGGKTIAGPRSFPDRRPSSRGKGTVTFAYFKDPEGHLIGLCSGILQPANGTERTP